MAEDVSTTYKSPAAAVEAARKLWLSATCQLELDEVERLYRWALSTKKSQLPSDYRRDYGEIISNEERCDGPSKKRIKQSLTDDGGGCGLTREQFNQAGEKYALLLCQSGRCHKAKKGLISMGFICRLAKQVLDYPSDDDYCKSNIVDDTLLTYANKRSRINNYHHHLLVVKS